MSRPGPTPGMKAICSAVALNAAMRAWWPLLDGYRTEQSQGLVESTSADAPLDLRTVHRVYQYDDEVWVQGPAFAPRWGACAHRHRSDPDRCPTHPQVSLGDGGAVRRLFIR